MRRVILELLSKGAKVSSRSPTGSILVSPEAKDPRHEELFASWRKDSTASSRMGG